MEPIGYVYSDSSVLCLEHAAVRGLEDEDNETGQAGAIFSTDDAEHNIMCDVRHSGGFYVILEQNTVDE